MRVGEAHGLGCEGNGNFNEREIIQPVKRWGKVQFLRMSFQDELRKALARFSASVQDCGATTPRWRVALFLYEVCAGMKSQISLFLKGFVMGTVDIVPGVSGSTVAVLLGYYERFIAALKSVDTSLFRSIWGMFRSGFSSASRAECVRACRNADLPWLVNLLFGLGTAFIAASFVIPKLMEKYPSVMWGLFFGLVLGSIVTPWRNVSRWRASRFVVIAIFAAGCYYLLGQHMHAPVAIEHVVTDGTKTLSSLCEEAACFYTPGEVYAMEANAALRGAVGGAEEIVRAGVSVALPKAYYLYCLLAGFCGICAMLLPGISGSFILLVMGCYYFMLHTGKSLLHGISQGVFYPSHLLYIVCFGVGALCGIALFSRTLTYLLKAYRDATLCAIIGILLGCLRAIWPFKSFEDGVQVNVLPALNADIVPVAVACAAGLGIVIATVILQERDKTSSVDSPTVSD